MFGKNYGQSILIRLALACVILVIAGIGVMISVASDTASASNGMNDFNYMQPSEFQDGMFVSGTVYEIFDEFAYYEEYNETLGIKHNERVTSRYYVVPLVGSYETDQPMYVAVKFSSSDLITRANTLIDQTWNYYDYGTEPAEWGYIDITGKVSPLQGELLDYFYEWFMYGDEEATRADYASMICPYVISYYSMDAMPGKIVAGLVMTLIGIAGIAIMVIVYVKKNRTVVMNETPVQFPESTGGYNPVNTPSNLSAKPASGMDELDQDTLDAMAKLKQPENNIDDFFAPKKKTEEEKPAEEPEKKEPENSPFIDGGDGMDGIDTSMLGIGIDDYDE